MDERARSQIDLIVTRECNLAMREYVERRTAIYQEHAAEGRLQSGATVKVVIGEMRRAANQLVDTLSPAVKAVSTELAAFEVLRRGVMALFDDFTVEMIEVVRIATGGSQMASVERAAAELFGTAKADCQANLQILAFDFEMPNTQHLAAASATSAPRKQGGRPPAEFWDDMWAAMATALYDGTLKPKTQADIERSMAEWIEARGHSAADSTVRARARRLWDRLAATND